MAGIKIVLGGGMFLSRAGWEDPSKLKILVDALIARGVHEIDTAQGYGDAEDILGESEEVGNSFAVATKLPGIITPGSLRREEVIRRTHESLQKLRVDQFDILYLHSPDPSIPIEETLSGVQELFVAGAFRRFGLSNHTTEEVQSVYDHQRSKGWVLPSVYQGMYNPIARHYETDLLPLLRKLRIAFYAYSPTAGGFLAKTKQQVLDGVGRFAAEDAQGAFYNELFNKPALLDVLAPWADIARDAGLEPYHLASRWVAYNSELKPEYGDALILGVKDVEQLEENVAGLKEGPLAPEICTRIEGLWEGIRHESPVVDVSFITTTAKKLAEQSR